MEIALGRKKRESDGVRKIRTKSIRFSGDEVGGEEADGRAAEGNRRTLGVVGMEGKWEKNEEEWRAWREKWTRGGGRLPTQTEWEEMFGHYEERRGEDYWKHRVGK